MWKNNLTNLILSLHYQYRFEKNSIIPLDGMSMSLQIKLNYLLPNRTQNPWILGNPKRLVTLQSFQEVRMIMETLVVIT